MILIEQTYTFRADVEDRADRLIARHIPIISRTQATRLIKDGCVYFVSGEKLLDPSRKVKADQKICVTIPEAKPVELTALKLPLDIIFEDEYLLVINKPAGLTVHPAPGHADDTLVNALLSHCGDTLSGIGGVMRPGIVHRLDKDTSGLMLVAKNDTAHHSLATQLADRTLSRTYIAFVHGMPRIKSGKVETLIGRHPKNRKKMAVVGMPSQIVEVACDIEARRPTERGRLKGTLADDVRKIGKVAITNYKTLAVYGGGKFSKIECKLETGRTHQIRVHLAHIGCPIVGDSVYGKKVTSDKWQVTSKIKLETALPRQALHALKIEFVHPATGKHMSFESKLPADMLEWEQVNQ